jgi:HEAT repeat protein
MIEELSMRDKYGEEYDDYRSKTPFLFPMPKWLKTVFKAPMRLVTKERFPQSRKQIAGITIVYTLIFVAISLIWVDLGMRDDERHVNLLETDEAIEHWVDIINNTIDRREMSAYFNILGEIGEPAVNQLVMYLASNDPVKREFAANQLGWIKDTAAVIPLIASLEDDVWRVRRSASNALAEIGDHRAADPIFSMMVNSSAGERPRYYELMGRFGVAEAWPYLVEGLYNEKWYIGNEALHALVDIDAEKAMPYVFEALKDTNYRKRRTAVFILLNLKPSTAVEPLKGVLDDEDFETRFYAQQAINLIEKENKP